MENIETVTYTVNNSIEIIELFCSERFAYDEVEEYEIILNRLEEINKNYEKYMEVEKNDEFRMKAKVLNSFYQNYNELKEELELNSNERMVVNLPKSQEMKNLLISLYKKMFVTFDNVKISENKIFNMSRIIIQQNGKILK